MNEIGDQNDPVSLIGEIAETGRVVANGKYLLDASLVEVELGLLQPNQLIYRQRVIEESLRSGAMETVTIEYVSADGKRFQPAADSVPLAGLVSIDVHAEREYTFGGTHRESQHSNLQLCWHPNTMMPNFDFSPDVPFDETMGDDTKEAWLSWGIRLDYAANSTRYAAQPLSNMVTKQLEMLNRLRHIATSS